LVKGGYIQEPEEDESELQDAKAHDSGSKDIAPRDSI